MWRFLYKSSVKDIYSCLVRTSETPKCIEKWSKVLAVEIDTKAVFDKIFTTTREKCLIIIWFQYKLLYNLLPTGRFLFQRQLVDSPVSSAKMLKKLYYTCFGIAQKSRTHILPIQSACIFHIFFACLIFFRIVLLHSFNTCLHIFVIGLSFLFAVWHCRWTRVTLTCSLGSNPLALSLSHHAVKHKPN